MRAGPRERLLAVRRADPSAGYSVETMADLTVASLVESLVESKAANLVAH